MPDKHDTYKIYRQGDNVRDLLQKIEDIGLATYTKPGLITADDKRKLDGLADISIKTGSTAFWDAAVGYIPKPGELIIYNDYRKETRDGIIHNIPGMKIGTGNAYVQDLMFITDIQSDALLEHIRNHDIHVTQAEKEFWNRKLNVTDAQEVVGEALVFNRN